MTLKPLKREQLTCLIDILQKRIAESKLETRSTLSDAIKTLERGYDGRFMGAYVDDFDDPKHCLIMAHFPGMATKDVLANICLIYSAPEERGNPENTTVLLQTAENYARMNSATSVVGTSWIYRGCKDSGPFWKANGFEVQETAYVKFLT